MALAEPLYGTRLLFGSTAQPRASWDGSPIDAISGALAPLLGSRAILVVAVWAAAAVVAPWVVRGESAPARALGAIAWATGLVAATGLLGARTGGPGSESLLFGAVLAVSILLARLPGRGGAATGSGVA